MKTTGIFTTHEYNIAAKQGEPFHLVFFGDVHRDSPHFAHSKWREFLEHCKRIKHRAYFFGMGDYIDSMSTSERDAIAKASLHESTEADLDGLATSKINVLAKELSFMKGRLVGLLNGNHYYSYPSGMTSDHKLCEKLECRFLGVSTFTRLNVSFGPGNTRTLDIWAHHGAGGARLVGGSINRVDQMREHAEADIYAMGHDHRRAAVPANPRLSLDKHNGAGLLLKERQQWLLRSGSFLAAYEDGKAGYNVDAARGPCSLGWVELEVTPRKACVGGACEKRLDIRAIA